MQKRSHWTSLLSKKKRYKCVLHSFCLTELCDLWCMTSQLRGAQFSGKLSRSMWIPATAGVSSALLCFSVSHYGKGELLDGISESMIRTNVVEEWIFCAKPWLKPNVVHVLAPILHITKRGHSKNRASWGKGNPICQTQHCYPGCNSTRVRGVN